MMEKSEEVLLSKQPQLNPLAAMVYTLVLVSSITLMKDWIEVAYLFALATLVALALTKRPVIVSRWYMAFLPMGIGLGLFAAVAGQTGAPMIETLMLVLLRVETAVAGSIAMVYASDPWELALSLRQYTRLPANLTYTIALAYVILQSLLGELAEAMLVLKSRKILTNPLSVVLRLHLLAYILVYAAARRAEELQIALEARGFNPYGRRMWRRIKFTARDAILPFFTIAATTFLILT